MHKTDSYNTDDIGRSYRSYMAMMMMEQGACAAQRPERLLPDEFWIYSYKVATCPIRTSHDWEKCVYAHEGEKARRRPPNTYQAVMCPEARAKKVCPCGEECPCTHHLFEYWLHPDRYMTCLCELGPACNRPICFFAHHPSEVRPLPDGLTHAPNATGSSRRRAAAAAAASAAAAAAVQGVSMAPPASALGLRDHSTGSLASSGGSYGPSADILTSAAYPSMGGASPVSMLLQQQQHQTMVSGGVDARIRPGFVALDGLSVSGAMSHPGAASPGAASLTNGNLAAAGAAGGNQGRPSVLVLEAPPPAMHSTQDLTLLQAAQQFTQLNLTAAGAGWLSPATGQSGSDMSLASSGSGTVGIQALGRDAQLLAGASAATSAAMLLEVQQQQQLLRARSVSPRVSPGPGGRHSPGLLGLSGSPGGVRMAQQQPPGAAYSALVGTAGQAQLAAMQAAMDHSSPEHLSFSLWDLNPASGPGPSVPGQAQQQLSQLAQAALQNPGPSGSTHLGGFDGFQAGYGRGSMGGSSPSARVAHLAGAAADRLLVARAQSSPGSATGSMAAMSEPLPTPSAVGADAETAKEARLTLLQAWVNAAVSAVNGASRCLDGSLEQQEDRMLRAAGDGGNGSVGRLTPRGLAVVALDLRSVLAPPDMIILVQQLQGMLQN